MKQRETKQKRAVLQILEKSGQKHLTADDIEQRLKKSQLAVSRATIYRTLLQLQSEGIVRKYNLPDNSQACYQFVDNSQCSEHYHMACNTCGAIVHFENSALKSIFCQIEKDTDIIIEGEKTIFYGLCQKCIEHRQ